MFVLPHSANGAKLRLRQIEEKRERLGGSEGSGVVWKGREFVEGGVNKEQVKKAALEVSAKQYEHELCLPAKHKEHPLVPRATACFWLKRTATCSDPFAARASERVQTKGRSMHRCVHHAGHEAYSATASHAQRGRTSFSYCSDAFGGNEKKWEGGGGELLVGVLMPSLPDVARVDRGSEWPLGKEKAER